MTRRLPGQPTVGGAPSAEAEPRAGGDEPGPAVGLLGVPDPGRRPAEGVPREAQRALDVKAAGVGTPTGPGCQTLATTAAASCTPHRC